MQCVFVGDIDQEFDQLVELITTQQQRKQIVTSNSSSWSRNASLRPSFTADYGLIVLQQLSGQPSVLSYATVLLDGAGWSGHVSVASALCLWAASTATVCAVDRVGRKHMLMVCCTVLCAAATCLALAFWFPTTATSRWIILVAMLAYIGGYQLGFGPITWLIVSEVFPDHVRGPATALGVELNYLLNFAVQFVLPLVQDRVGWGPTFLMFAIVMLFGIGFVARLVPETTGLTLEEIEETMRNQNGGEGAKEQLPLVGSNPRYYGDERVQS